MEINPSLAFASKTQTEIEKIFETNLEKGLESENIKNSTAKIF